jgi:putative exporter of polyketide antibiotics
MNCTGKDVGGGVVHAAFQSVLALTRGSLDGADTRVESLQITVAVIEVCVRVVSNTITDASDGLTRVVQSNSASTTANQTREETGPLISRSLGQVSVVLATANGVAGRFVVPPGSKAGLVVEGFTLGLGGILSKKAGGARPGAARPIHDVHAQGGDVSRRSHHLK